MNEKWYAVYRCDACAKIWHVEPELVIGVPVETEDAADKMVTKLQRASNVKYTRRRHVCSRDAEGQLDGIGWGNFVGLVKRGGKE